LTDVGVFGHTYPQEELMADVMAPPKLLVHWPNDLRMEDGTRDVLLAAARRQVPGVEDVLVLPDGESETGQYVYLKFADRILRYTLVWV
jgi:hypothetical protein